MRERMVTRTVKASDVTILAVNLDTKETFEESVLLSTPMKDEKSIMKYLVKHYDDETKKAVSILNIDEIENLYGMSETDFIAQAKILPARTTK